MSDGSRSVFSLGRRTYSFLSYKNSRFGAIRSLVSTHSRTFFVPLATIVIVPPSPLRPSGSLVPRCRYRAGRCAFRSFAVRRVLR